MAKKTQYLKPDIILKNYWSSNEQFADLFNAVLFDGRQLIKPDELEDMDTEESSVPEHRDYAESIEASRDTIKIQKKSSAYGVQLVLLGLENQEHIHYAMPMRVMGYDYASYKKQYDSNARQYKDAKGLTRDEYLSRMKKTDRLIPVITVVMYYGENAWDAAKSLHEMLKIPEEMAGFVNDYKILLVEARQNRLTLHNLNNRDLFHLLHIFLDENLPKKEARQKAIDYSEEHHTDKTVVMTAAGAANIKLDYHAFEKGGARMYTLFEEIKKEGRTEGLAEGRTEGKAAEIVEMGQDFGLSDTAILERLQKKLNLPLQTAQEYLHIFGKQTV